MKTGFDDYSKLKVFRALIDRMYPRNRLSFKRGLYQLFFKHQKDKGQLCNGFLYKETHYMYSANGRGLILPLSAKLSTEMALLLKEDTADIEMEKAQISAYLTRALNLAKVPADLLLLLPDSLHDALPKSLMQSAEYTAPTVTDKLMQFQEENAADILKLKERLLISTFFDRE